MIIVSIGIYCPTRRVVQQLVEVIPIPEFAKIFDCGIVNLKEKFLLVELGFLGLGRRNPT